LRREPVGRHSSKPEEQMVLEAEIRYFEAQKQELLKHHERLTPE
jgi:hypothetical protein